MKLNSKYCCSLCCRSVVDVVFVSVVVVVNIIIISSSKSNINNSILLNVAISIYIHSTTLEHYALE